jgi:hypothetical protein
MRKCAADTESQIFVTKTSIYTDGTQTPTIRTKQSRKTYGDRKTDSIDGTKKPLEEGKSDVSGKRWPQPFVLREK